MTPCVIRDGDMAWAMTPCVIRDGDIAWAMMDTNDNPICIGCERTPNELGLREPKNWKKMIEDYKRNQRRRRP
jgi:hypothetical protein